MYIFFMRVHIDIIKEISGEVNNEKKINNRHTTTIFLATDPPDIAELNKTKL